MHSWLAGQRCRLITGQDGNRVAVPGCTISQNASASEDVGRHDRTLAVDGLELLIQPVIGRLGCQRSLILQQLRESAQARTTESA